MGTLRKHGKKWRAEVCVSKVRRSKVCRTKPEAMTWIVEQESKLEDGPDHSVAELLERYTETHISRKKQTDRETALCKRLSAAIGHYRLKDISSDDLARWRDARLSVVKPATVRREWNLLSHAFNVAMKEWGWLKANPLTALTRPAPSAPRSRVITDEEVERLLYCCAWPGDTLQARVGDCLLFALETGMRAGEICGLRPDMDRKTHVHIPAALAKNGHARDVPLSTKARKILDSVGSDFGIKTSQLDALFRKAKARANLDDLVFHDSRRTALTRLSKKLDVLELARVSGHRDLKILLQVYYAPEISHLAGKLD